MDYTTLASPDSIAKTSEALAEHHYEPIVLATKAGALDKIKELIHAGATVMNGASKTLQEIGYIDYVKSGQHPWKNLHDAILAESDPAKQTLMRRQSVVSDFYLGSVHALTETGEMLIASNTGSQLPHLAYTSPNIILVVGANKIVPSIADGFERLKNHVVPLENERMKAAHGMGTTWSKTLIMHRERATTDRKIHVIIVQEVLGF